jgi:malonate-semialdehyde dehydrogenase (acetylating)/methylmalonate-semialdehyde dehydrogenase
MAPIVRNYINGEFVTSLSPTIDVINPANGSLLAKVPLCTKMEVAEAVAAAKAAFPSWRETPPAQRIQYLFKMKELMESHFEDIAQIVTKEHGKVLAEARGDVRRGIDNLDQAVGIPNLMMGESLENVASGIDCVAYARPMGVFTAIAPFNFPAMVPFWFMPYAIATGNTFLLKPSEQVPLTQEFVFELWHKTGLPKGVLNMVHGAKDVVDAFCTHPDVVGVSFVGSTPVARHVYTLSTQNGKRVQALGGAKNFMIVMPDANMAKTANMVAESCYGCAGQRCLAASVILTVGESAHTALVPEILKFAKTLKLGDGLKDNVEIGPVISTKSRDRILKLIANAESAGAKVLLDGRKNLEGTHPEGSYVGPTLIDGVTPDMEIAYEEIFGPVLCLTKVNSMDEVHAIMNAHPCANTTSIYTQSGAHARAFTHQTVPSMIGVNIGVPAPMSYFGFGRAKESFFVDTKAHGRYGVEFYTDKKVIIQRWF